MKIHSDDVTRFPEAAASRAMMRAVGLDDDDFAKPQVGVVSAGNEVTPCNTSGPRLAARAKEGVAAAGGVGLTFATIAVSDGISMGHEGMRASLVSREVIADSIETMVHAERMDALGLVERQDLLVHLALRLGVRPPLLVLELAPVLRADRLCEAPGHSE